MRLDKAGMPDFAALQAAVKSGETGDLMLFAFDALYAFDHDIRNRDLLDRKQQLRRLLEDAGGPLLIKYVTHLDVSGTDIIKAACAMKLEGIISKRISAPYVSGRTGAWTKSKCRAGQHAVVGGWISGSKGFRGLLLGVRRGRKLIPIGRVGTGFPSRLLDKLLPRLKELEAEGSPFSEPIKRKPDRQLHWIKPDLIAEVEFTSWTHDRLLRQASLNEVRERTDRKLRPDWINLPEEDSNG